MLDCFEKKCSCNCASLKAIDSIEIQQHLRPMSEHKVSFHRRFVESQKKLKIAREKLMQAELRIESLQSALSNVSKDEYHLIASTRERPQLEFTESKKVSKNESDRHKETQRQLLHPEEKILAHEDDMNEIHDSRLAVTDLTQRLDLISNENSDTATSQGKDIHETTKMKLHAAHYTISMLTEKMYRLCKSQVEDKEKSKNITLEAKAIVHKYEGQIQRQELELTVVRADQFKVQSQIEEQRSMLWQIEEDRHYNRLRWMKLSESLGRTVEMDHDAKNYDIMVDQCRSNATIASLRQKNRYLEKLKISLSAELRKKNDVICKMSRCTSFVEVLESVKEEQERSLCIATELSVAYAESQMKVDKLTEVINRLKLTNSKSDSQGYQSPFQSTTSKLDGIKSISSIFSRSFNASFIGMNTSCNANNNDSHPVKVELISRRSLRTESTISCGNDSEGKITKTPSGLKINATPITSNQNKEKVSLCTAFTDKCDVFSGSPEDRTNALQL